MSPALSASFFEGSDGELAGASMSSANFFSSETAEPSGSTAPNPLLPRPWKKGVE